MLMDHSPETSEDYQIMVDPFVMPGAIPEEPKEFTEYMKLARQREIQRDYPGCSTEEDVKRLKGGWGHRSRVKELNPLSQEAHEISKEAYDCLRGVVRAGGLTGVIKEVT